MTDLLEPYVDTAVDDLPPLETTGERGTADKVPAPFLAYLLAACLTGAGVIHLAMVPGHMAEWRPEGWSFLATAVLQLGIALGLVVRPRRWMAAVALASSAALIYAWWFTRYAGMPFGPSEHYLEDATTVDVTCVVLEAAAIAVSLVILVAPRLTARWKPSLLVFASMIPLAALVAGGLAVSSPAASAHAGHSEGGAHGKDDLGLWKLSNGHHHAITNNTLDPATQAELDRQLDLTRQVAATYPTVAAAEAAGYKRAGPYSPGLGAHYVRSGGAELNPDGLMSDDDLLHPQAIIYDGIEPTSEVAGFMYYSMSPTEPAGFPGTNDTWHIHSNVCIKPMPDGTIDSPLGADRGDVTQADCEAVGGFLLPLTQWMVHVWSVPGWDNVKGGVFAEVNPKLACSDGTYFTANNPDNTVPPLNNCRSGAPGQPRYAV